MSKNIVVWKIRVVKHLNLSVRFEVFCYGVTIISVNFSNKDIHSFIHSSIIQSVLQKAHRPFKSTALSSIVDWNSSLITNSIQFNSITLSYYCMCVKVIVIRSTQYASLCVSLSNHDEIFSKKSIKDTGYILPKTLHMTRWDRWKQQKMTSEC